MKQKQTHLMSHDLPLAAVCPVVMELFEFAFYFYNSMVSGKTPPGKEDCVKMIKSSKTAIKLTWG